MNHRIFKILFIDDEHRKWTDVFRFPAETYHCEIIPRSDPDAAVLEFRMKRRCYDAIILDLKFKGDKNKGIRILGEVKTIDRRIPVLILTASYNAEDIETAIECIKYGAFHYLGKTRLDADKMFDLLVRYIIENRRIRISANESGPEKDMHDSILDLPDRSIFGFCLDSIILPTTESGILDLPQEVLTWHEDLLHTLAGVYNNQINVRLKYIKPAETLEITVLIVFEVIKLSSLDVSLFTASGLLSEISVFFTHHKAGHRVYSFRMLEKTEIAMIAGQQVTGATTLYFGNTEFSSLIPDSASFHRIGTLLSRMSSISTYCEIEVCLSPTNLSDSAERELLFEQNRMLAINAGHEDDDDIERSTISTTIDNKRLLSTLERYLDFRNELFLIHVKLISEDAPSQVLLNQINDTFFQHDSYKEVLAHHPVEMLANYSDLKCCFTPVSASLIFKLPFPHPNLSAHLNTIRKHHVYIPADICSEGILLGIKNIAGKIHPINISASSLSRHMYILGQTGTGKTTMLKGMIRDFMRHGKGFAVIDPHGDLSNDIIENLPVGLRDKVVLFDPTEDECPIRINVIECDPSDPRHKTLIFNELVRLTKDFYKFDEAFGPVFEYWLRTSLDIVIDTVNGTLHDFMKFYDDKQFRDSVIDQCKNPVLSNRIKSLIDMRWDSLNWTSWALYITSKLLRFTEDCYIAPIISARKSNINFRQIMDEGKVLIVRIPKARLGTDGLVFFGSVLFNRLVYAAYSRENIHEKDRIPFTIFVDEFQNFVSRDIYNGLAELRKYGVSLVLANQSLSQLDADTASALLANAGTFATFRPGIMDVDKVLPYFYPPFTRQELLELSNYQVITRMMIKDKPSRSFKYDTQLV